MDYTLEDVIRFSSVIAIAEPDDPPVVDHWIHFEKDEQGQSFGKRNSVPPYRQSRYRFRVVECLRGEYKPGAKIEVVEAQTSMRQREHYNYYARDMTMCIAWERYYATHTVDDDGRRFLFLQQELQPVDGENASEDPFPSPRSRALTFVAHGSMEGMGALATVRQLLSDSDGSL